MATSRKQVENRNSSVEYANYALGLVVVLLCLYHFFQIWLYAVNLPFWDEWTILKPGELSPEFSLEWVFRQYNEHRMITDKALIWLLYRIDGWNIANHQLLNFVIYAFMLYVAVKLAQRVAPDVPLYIWLAFVIFMLSPLNHENHQMAFQSNFHFVVLFNMLSIFFLFRTQNKNGEATQSWGMVVGGTLCALLSMYSLSSGVLYNVVILSCFSIFKWAQAAARTGPAKRQELLQWLFVALAIALGAFFWLQGWKTDPDQVPKAMPVTLYFWTWFLSMLGAGFAFETYSPLAGLACLLIIVAPLTMPLWARGERKTFLQEPRFWTLAAAALGLLLVLFFVSIGRSSVGMGMSKTPRYVEFVLMLLPTFVAGVWWLLQQRETAQLNEAKYPTRRLHLPYVGVGLLWIFCFFSFLNNWTFFRYYSDKFMEREAGGACVAKYYATNPDHDWRCRSIYPSPLNVQLEQSKKLNLSFVQERINNPDSLN